MDGNVFQIGAVVDVGQLNSGFDNSQTAAKAYVESMNLMFDDLGGKGARAYQNISEASKQAAASVTGDQLSVAQATAAVGVATRENARAYVLVKNNLGDADAAARLYAATLTQLGVAQANLKSLTGVVAAPVQAPTADANSLVGAVAHIDTSEVSQREAAATLELAEAKANLREVNQALGDSDLDAATKSQALAAAQDEVRAKEAALATVQDERRGIQKAQTLASEEQLAAERARAQGTAAAAAADAGASATGSASAQRLAAAILEKSAADKELKSATDQASNSLLTEAERLALVAPAAARARIASLELAEANEALAHSSHSVVTGQQATSAAIKAVEGNAGLRAIENFVAKTLGLGPALQSIFPLIGAFAFGKILFDMGEKAYELGQKAAHAGQAIQDAFAEAHDKAQLVNDDLAIQNDKLGDEIAKLSGHPNNGLATALDEGRKIADRLLASLQADRKELAALLQQNEVGGFGSLLSGVAATGQQGEELLKDQANLIKAVREAKNQYNAETADATDQDVIKVAGDKRSSAVRKAFQTQIDTYKVEAARLKTEEDDSVKDNRAVANAGGSVPIVDNKAKIENIKGRTEQLQDALSNEGLIESIATREAEKGALKQHKTGRDESNKEAEQLLRDIETGLAERNRVRQREPAEVAAYWNQYLGSFRNGSTEYKKILDEVNHASEAASKDLFKTVLKSGDPGSAGILATSRAQREEVLAAVLKDQEEGDAALDKSTRALAKWATVTGENLTRTGDKWAGYWNDVAKGDEITAAIAESISLAQLRALEASGGISKLGAAQVEARLHADEHTAALKALQAELDRLEQSAKREFNPVSGKDEVTDPKQAAEIEAAKNKIAQQKGKGAAQGIGDASKIQQEMVAPYTKAFGAINGQFASLTGSVLKGQKSIAQGFREMAANMALDFIQGIEKMILKSVEHEVVTLAAHRAGNLAKVESDQVAAVQAKAIKGTSAAHEIFMDAKAAAAATWKAVAAIPIVGPALAPEAAALAFAGVAALAAFQDGGVIGGMTGAAQMVIGHEGERVLTKGQTEMFHQMVNGRPAESQGAGSPREVHLHMGENQFSSANGDFRSQFNEHQTHVKAQVKRWMRDGEL